MNNQKQKIMAVLLVLLLFTALVTTAAFLPASTVKNDASTRLAYRNYDDIMFDNSESDAATPPPPVTIKSKTINKRGSKSVEPDALNDDATFTALDVDADRMPLSILLEPPAAPLTQQKKINLLPSHSYPRVTITASRVTTHSSSVTQLSNIQDYHHHVFNSPDQLCVIRFHAPWCQVCRTNNVYWELMASKINKMNSSNRSVKFLSVTLDESNEEVAKLKDMLQIQSEQQGVVHYAREGLFGQRVHLNRKNLGKLKKQLESFLSNDMGADMFLYSLKSCP